MILHMTYYDLRYMVLLIDDNKSINKKYQIDTLNDLRYKIFNIDLLNEKALKLI